MIKRDPAPAGHPITGIWFKESAYPKRATKKQLKPIKGNSGPSLFVVLFEHIVIERKIISILRKTQEKAGGTMTTSNLKKETYEGFDVFIIQTMKRLKDIDEQEFALTLEENESIEENEIKDAEDGITEEERAEAFRYFWRRIDKRPIASNPTMRKWFGIGGKSWPSREQVYAVCLCLGLERNEVETFFLEGLLAPSFQVNDYREIIFLYGLDNGLDYDTCKDMIAFYEKNLDVSLQIEQTSRTNMLKTYYEEKKNLSQEEFLLWMQDNAKYFKGYSKTAYNCFLSLKSKVVELAKKDAGRRLKQYLAETDYEKWEKSHRLSRKSQREKIIQYILSDAKSKERKISQTMGDNIVELAGIACSSLETNSLLLSEIFTIKKKTGEKNMENKKPHVMTSKYLSDLINVASKKEQQILVDIALRNLEDRKDKELCPENIQHFIQKLSGDVIRREKVADARAWLKQFAREHKRRLVMIERADILPMVLYVAQQTYSQKLLKLSAVYKQQEARQEFLELAEGVLNACNMAPISPNYHLDKILLDSFGGEEMISFQDILEKEYEECM